jgi:hypothetical protein
MGKNLDTARKWGFYGSVRRNIVLPAVLETAAVQSLGKRMRLTINEPERANISTSG